MVMLNIYVKIISGFIFEAVTQVLEKLVGHFVTVSRFCLPIDSRRFCFMCLRGKGLKHHKNLFHLVQVYSIGDDDVLKNDSQASIKIIKTSLCKFYIDTI